MTTIHDLKPLEAPDILTLVLSCCVMGLVFFLFVCVYIYIFYKKRKKKLPQPSPAAPAKVRPSSLKDKYLKELEEINKSIDSGQYDLETIHTRLSEIIRQFINGFYNKSTLSKTKTELSELKIQELDEVIKNSYKTIFELKMPEVQATKDLIKIIETYIRNAV